MENTDTAGGAPLFCAASISAGTLSKRILKTQTLARGTKPKITSETMIVKARLGLEFQTNLNTRGMEANTLGASFKRAASDLSAAAALRVLGSGAVSKIVRLV